MKDLKNMKNKSIGIVCGYMLFYMVSFFLLEQLPVRQVIIHCRLDEMIPFCEYFIIPYVIWFFFVAGTVLYFLLLNESSSEYARLIGTLATGMTIFLIVSFVCPNRHMLRPNITEDGFFIDAVRLLYKIDTPTNIFPSIHVFNTAACFLAFWKNERCRKNKLAMAGIGAISVSIILSTMFLKQHTVIDVLGALVLNWICYGIFYKWMPENRELLTQLLNKKQIFTVVNLLNLIRMCVAIVFWGMEQRIRLSERQICLAGILLLSILIDYVNRRMVKKRGTESELETLLDLAADRVTQGVILLYLVSRYRMLEYLLIMLFVKEMIITFAGGSPFVKKHEKRNEFCYEKVSEAVLNAVLMILMFFPGITKQTANLLILISEVFMAASILLHLRCSSEIASEKKKDEQCG